MAILPLPVFEEELKAYEEDKRVYEALKVPKTLVVRFGFMKMVGEFPYQGDMKPGCGSKIVVRTHRGTEIGEMLTSTCPNSGCSKSVSRKEMLEYIQNSGGRDYPFFEHGRALRVATAEDMQEQSRIEQSKHAMRLQAKAVAARTGFSGKVVEIEPILGGEQITLFYHSEERLDFRELVGELQRDWSCRIEMRQVGARDEARVTADYERCGQYCCCKNFLKVLKPVSMRSAKVQKATLDPLKISGRCGRLMCCLRYEDQTYEDLRKRLPRNKSRVGTPDGDGMVIDSQILTQLVLVRLDAGDKNVAVAVEDLTDPVSTVAPDRPELRDTDRGRDGRPRREERPARPSRESRGGRPAGPGVAATPDRTSGQDPEQAEGQPPTGQHGPQDGGVDRPEGDDGGRRRRRRRGRGDGEPGGAAGPSDTRGPETGVPPTGAASGRGEAASAGDEIDLDDIETDFGDSAPSPRGPDQAQDQSEQPRRKKRRRRRRGGGGGGGPAAGPAGQPGGGPGGGGS